MKTRIDAVSVFASRLQVLAAFLEADQEEHKLAFLKETMNVPIFERRAFTHPKLGYKSEPALSW